MINAFHLLQMLTIHEQSRILWGRGRGPLWARRTIPPLSYVKSSYGRLNELETEEGVLPQAELDCPSCYISDEDLMKSN